jgi:hypothetical protein
MNNDTTNHGQPAGDYGNTHTRARRRFDAQMISEIARLCAKALTEAESCRRLGVNPKSWFSFKSRCGRESKFASLLEEFRAGRIESLIDKIEASADGKGLKQPDWRAAAHLLKISDQKRFGDSPTVEAAAPVMNIYAILGIDLSKLISEGYKQAEQAKAALTVASEAKQLPETTGSETTQKETP